MFKSTAKTVYNQSCSQRWIREDHDQSKLIESINFVILAGNRHRITSFSENVVVAGTSYQM